MLKTEGQIEDEQILELDIDLIALENDLLSLEMDSSFADFTLGSDDSYKVYIDKSIHQLEQHFGTIPCKLGLGYKSCKLIANI
jgi:hypothetical protein